MIVSVKTREGYQILPPINKTSEDEKSITTYQSSPGIHTSHEGFSCFALKQIIRGGESSEKSRAKDYQFEVLDIKAKRDFQFSISINLFFAGVSLGSPKFSIFNKNVVRYIKASTLNKPNRELILQDSRIIMEAYMRFQDSGQQDLSLLEMASDSLENINNQHKKLCKDGDEIAAQECKKELVKYRRVVQGMNMKSPIITMQDVRGFRSFFTKPVEQFYVDEENGEKYYQPDNSELFKVGFFFFANGNYKGVSVLKEMMLLNPETKTSQRCDVISLKKRADQEKYEYNLRHPGLFSCLGKLIFNSQKMKKRIEDQEACFPMASKRFEEKIKQWNYDSFRICNTDALIALNYPESVAIKHHIVVLYYKNVKNNEV